MHYNSSYFEFQTCNGRSQSASQHHGCDEPDEHHDQVWARSDQGHQGSSPDQHQREHQRPWDVHQAADEDEDDHHDCQRHIDADHFDGFANNWK